MFGLFRALRRRRLRRRPMPPEWPGYLDAHVVFYRDMPEHEREAFLDKLKLFVWEKHFIGAGGMEITDEVKVVIAAAAVRLIMRLPLSFYDRLTEIVVYPSDYVHPERDGIVFGEAHSWGTVVLSWDAVLAGLENPSDGHDTATHEFAHVLDRGGGSFDGTPELRCSSHYRPWAEIMSGHYLKLRAGKRRQRRVLRRYGATNEAEFFAVATEAFFEKPDQMRKHTPELFEELARFYGFDVASE